MTGYARVAVRDAERRTAVEITAVNNRFLKIQCKLPDALLSLRQKLEEAVRTRVLRGSLVVSVVHESPATQPRVRLNTELARAFLNEVRDLARELKLDPPRDLDVLARLPGVIQADEASARVTGTEGARILEVLDSALDKLTTDRQREGRSLARDMKQRVQIIGRELKVVRRHAPRVVETFTARLTERMNEFLARVGRSAEPQDILREVAAYAERVDVTEELTRLDTHLGHFRDLLAGGGECGKRIEFLLQEIHREVNTIGSKAGSSEVSPHIVSIKAEVEKIREQVQNIE